MTEEDKKQNLEYLGDGVYIRNIGWAIVLAVNHHDNRVIVLEDSVLSNLKKYLQTHNPQLLERLQK